MRMYLLSALAVFVPVSVSAASIFGTFPTLPEGVLTHSGVTSVNSVSVSTGGQVVSGGQSVSTQDGEASASITNIIHSSNSGGSVETTVRTNTNGVVVEEHRTQNFLPGERIELIVATSSHAESVETSPRARTQKEDEIVIADEKSSARTSPEQALDAMPPAFADARPPAFSLETLVNSMTTLFLRLLSAISFW